MRSILRGRLSVTKTAAGITAAAAVLLGSAQVGSAQAATASGLTVVANMWVGQCDGILYQDHDHSEWGKAVVYQSRDAASGKKCKAWVNMSTYQFTGTIDHSDMWAYDPGQTSWNGQWYPTSALYKVCVQEFPSTAIKCTGWHQIPQ